MRSCLRYAACASLHVLRCPAKLSMVIYLDNAATTPLFPEVIDLLHKLNQELFANPSSIHSQGRKAKKQLEKARQELAEILKADAEELFFTSGATESNNTIFKLLNYDLIITSPAEHASVIESAKSLAKPILWLSLDKEGFIDLDELEKYLEQNSAKKILVSVMHGNNEIGTINDIAVIAKITKKFSNVFFHSDCVQTFTKLEIDLSKLEIDFISASAHKIHGPKGLGLLYINKKIQEKFSLQLRPLIIGGSQEKDIRSGTENLLSIIAFALAAKLNSESSRKNKIKELQESLFASLNKIENLVINGPKDLNKRVPGSLNFALSNCKLKSEEMVLQLDLKGFAVSSGSACTSNKTMDAAEIESSYVLRACAIPEAIATKAIRISLSSLNSEREIESFIDALKLISAKFALKPIELV